MAMIDSHQKDIGQKPYESLQELVRDVTSSLIEELDAKNSYEVKIDRLKASTNEDIIKVRDDLIDMYNEIAGDEANHQGRLFSKLLALDPTAMKHIKAGMAGKEND